MPWLCIEGRTKDGDAAMQTAEPAITAEESPQAAQPSAPAQNGDKLEMAVAVVAQQVKSSLMQPPLPTEESGPMPGTVCPAWQPVTPHEGLAVYGPMPEGATGTLHVEQVCKVPPCVSISKPV
jgi:hypothetical protein